MAARYLRSVEDFIILKKELSSMFLRQFVRVLLLLGFLQGSAVWAATYWVAPSGSDGNPCTSVSGANDPGRYRTVTGGLSCIAAGDTLKLKNGTYNYSFPNGSFPSGPSPTQKTCIVGESRDGVIFRPDANKLGIVLGFIGARSNICIKNLTLDGVHQGTSGAKAGILQGGSCCHHNYEITDVVIKNFGINLQGIVDGGSLNGNGIVLDGNGTGHFLSRITLNNNGTPGTGTGGGIYWRADNSIIEHSTISNGAAYGILMYSSDASIDNNIVRYNVFNGNLEENLYISTGVNNVVHNNVSRGSHNGIRARRSSNKIYNNTVYGATTCIRLQGNSHVVRNNIALNCGTVIRNESLESTISNNLTSGSASNIFINPAAGDFRLKADSPAIDAGTAVGSIALDFAGTSIPQGCCYDIGAYEYVRGVITPPLSPSDLRVVPQ
jgi:Periplasmic copper-binding protein (NosD)